ncbi:isochorismatase family protein [Teredinibacter haidensis]|uniref:isochorismatase family protein n=1 Tax=Teredinibacter haidensis TaxID=2731755 RepID=UPI000948DC61|nr:isochorismatase family protein [Teredinibacter haidensis]
MSIPSIPSYSLPGPDELPVNRVTWQPQSDRAVLLVHDMQNYFARFYGEVNPLLQQLQNNIAEIISWARSQRIPVVYTAQPANQTTAQRALLNHVWGPGLTDADPEQQNIVPLLQPEKGDTVLVKWRYSAFQRSHLQDLMNEWQRDQLIIVGVYAHIGCLTTALDAFMRDIKPFMVADAVADFSEEEHHMALKYVAGRCGAVIHKEQLLDSLVKKLTREGLKATLLELIDEDEQAFDPDENLVDYGLDSVQVMGLMAEWEKLGFTFRFEELAREPTLNGWWALIQEKMAA